MIPNNNNKETNDIQIQLQSIHVNSRIQFLYVDESIIVIHKPSLLRSVPGHFHTRTTSSTTVSTNPGVDYTLEDHNDQLPMDKIENTNSTNNNNMKRKLSETNSSTITSLEQHQQQTQPQPKNHKVVTTTTTDSLSTSTSFYKQMNQQSWMNALEYYKNSPTSVLYHDIQSYILRFESIYNHDEELSFNDTIICHLTQLLLTNLYKKSKSTLSSLPRKLQPFQRYCQRNVVTLLPNHHFRNYCSNGSYSNNSSSRSSSNHDENITQKKQMHKEEKQQQVNTQTTINTDNHYTTNNDDTGAHTSHGTNNNNDLSSCTLSQISNIAFCILREKSNEIQESFIQKNGMQPNLHNQQQQEEQQQQQSLVLLNHDDNHLQSISQNDTVNKPTTTTTNTTSNHNVQYQFDSYSAHGQVKLILKYILSLDKDQLNHHDHYHHDHDSKTINHDNTILPTRNNFNTFLIQSFFRKNEPLFQSLRCSSSSSSSSSSTKPVQSNNIVPTGGGNPQVTNHSCHDFIFKNYYDVHIVHRLDCETSGVMVFARSNLVASKLSQIWRMKSLNHHLNNTNEKQNDQSKNENENSDSIVTKIYLARVKYWPPYHEQGITEGCIDLPIGRVKNEKIKWEVKQDDDIDGKPCKTLWKVVHNIRNQMDDDTNNNAGNDQYNSKELVTLELQPITGRTHQLRVHCASVGSGIIGDTLYGDEVSKYQIGIPKDDVETNSNSISISVLQLHSFKLSFPHPITNMIVEYQSDHITWKEI